MFVTNSQFMSNQLKPIYPMKKGIRPDITGAVRILAVILFITAAYPLQAARYFWVGGAGNWNDLNHWAGTSGGSEKYLSLPGAFDDVIFDANSGFAAGNNTVTLDSAASCKNMDWSAATNTPVFTDGANNYILTVRGNITLSAGMTFEVNTVIFDDLDRYPYYENNRLITITTNGVVFNANVAFDGGDHIRLADNFNIGANDIYVFNYGNLDVRNITINARNIFIQSGPFIDMRGTQIVCVERMNITGFPSIINTGSSITVTDGFIAPSGAEIASLNVVGVPADATQNINIQVPNTSFRSFNVNMGATWTGNLTLSTSGGASADVFNLTIANPANNVHFSGSWNVNRSGSINASQGSVHLDNGSIYAYNADSFSIGAGSDILINPSRTLNASRFTLMGTAADSIYISSSHASNVASFYAEYANHCFDHVVFTRIDATNGTGLNAPLTSDNGGNFGITFAATCGDTVPVIVTSNPSILNICENTQFTITYTYSGPLLFKDPLTFFGDVNQFQLERSDDKGNWVGNIIASVTDSVPVPFTLNMPSLWYNASGNYRFRVNATRVPNISGNRVEAIGLPNASPVQLGYEAYAWDNTGSQTVDPYQAVVLDFEFDGMSPFTFTYTDGISLVTTTTSERRMREYTTINANRYYEILNVFNSCGVGMIWSGFSVNTQSGYDNENPSMTIFGDTTICRQLSGGNDYVKVWAGVANTQYPDEYEVYYESSEYPGSINNMSLNDYVDYTSEYPQVNQVTFKPVLLQNNWSGTSYFNVDGILTATINSRPRASISMAPNSLTTICQGSSTDLQIDFNAGTAPWTVTYDAGGSPITISGITSNPFIFSVTPHSSTDYSLNTNFASVTSGLCSSELYANNGSEYITVQTPATISLLTGDSTIAYCTPTNAADTFKLLVAINGGASPYSISITDGTNNFAISGFNEGDTTVIPFFPNATTTYTITGISSGGVCPGGLVNAVPVVATVTPVANLTAVLSGTQAICAMTPAILTFNITGGMPATLIVNHGVTQQTINNIISSPYYLNVSPTVTTNYSIVSVKNKCGFGAGTGNAVVTVNNTPVSASFNVIPMGNNTFRFINTSLNATSYTWNFGDGTVFTDVVSDTIHTYSVTGIYQVSLTASNACNSQTSVQTVSSNATSIENSLENAEIKVYPNPSNGLFFLEISGAEQSVNVTVENLQGQVVYQSINNTNGTRMELDIKNNAAGVYLLHLSNDQGRVVRKLIVQ
jgi:hypothetical protein